MIAFRQLRHINDIGQFSTDIRHIAGAVNYTADFLSRISSITTNEIDYKAFATAQKTDDEITEMRSDTNKHSLDLKLLTLLNTDVQVWCDVSHDMVRPLVLTPFRTAIMQRMHDIAHTGARRQLLDIADWQAVTTATETAAARPFFVAVSARFVSQPVVAIGAHRNNAIAVRRSKADVYRRQRQSDF